MWWKQRKGTRRNKFIIIGQFKKYLKSSNKENSKWSWSKSVQCFRLLPYRCRIREGQVMNFQKPSAFPTTPELPRARPPYCLILCISTAGALDKMQDDWSLFQGKKIRQSRLKMLLVESENHFISLLQGGRKFCLPKPLITSLSLPKARNPTKQKKN